jgi:hypothetical protein
MRAIRFTFGALTLDADLLDTPTAAKVLATLPVSSRVLTWGEEVYFELPVEIARERGARDLMQPGDIAWWPDGSCIAIGFGRTPISAPGEIRLASPCNVFAKARGDVRSLAPVKAGSGVRVEVIG